MSDKRQIISENIAKLRKSMKLTQADLAERMNYSDKAISKWERGDSIPDVLVLAELAELFSVTVDYFLHEHTETEGAQVVRSRRRPRRVAIALTSCISPFVISLILSLIFLQVYDNPSWLWKLFVFPLPAVSIISLIFTAVWVRNRVQVFLWASAVLWTTVLLLFVLLYQFSSSWLLFVIGAPIEIILFFWIGLHKNTPGS